MSYHWDWGQSSMIVMNRWLFGHSLLPQCHGNLHILGGGGGQKGVGGYSFIDIPIFVCVSVEWAATISQFLSCDSWWTPEAE